MSLSGRNYTERQRLDLYEERLSLYNKVEGICEVCGKYIPMNDFEIAHRIPNSPTWRKKYGKAIIDNRLNLAVTHKACNASVLLVNQPIIRGKLVASILADIDKGK